MIPLATALAVVRPWGVPLTPATVPVADALGCVLAAPAPVCASRVPRTLLASRFSIHTWPPH